MPARMTRPAPVTPKARATQPAAGAPVITRVVAGAQFWPRAILGAAGFGAAVLLGVVHSLLRRDRSHVASDIAHLIGRFVCPAARLRLQVSHAMRLEAAQPCVYVANHQSFLDYAILGAIYPPRTVVLGRADLARMPVIGWLYRATGNLLVDRGDPASRRAALEAMVRAVRGGSSVWVFPEGTRNAGAPGALLPFRRGAFHVAVAAGVPVVPIVVEPLRPRTDLRARRLEARTVRVVVLDPVPPRGRDASALRDAVQEQVQGVLASLAGGTVPGDARAVAGER